MIEVDIVTPQRRLIVGAKANAVKLPAQRGEIEVLAGHTELLTLLGTGVVSFVNDGRERRFAVSYGFAEVRGNRVLILAETAEESSEIDKERAVRARKKAEQTLGSVLTPEQFRKYELKLQRAIIRQQIAP